MFILQGGVRKKTVKKRTNRKNYIHLLVCEFNETTLSEAKEQICCNLANFAYDPNNFKYLRQSNVLKVFLNCISSDNDKLKLAGITGICNFCLDPEIKSDLIIHSSIQLIRNLLINKEIEIILKAVATLILLIDDNLFSNIIDLELVPEIISLNKSENSRIKTITSLFLNEIARNKLVNDK